MPGSRTAISNARINSDLDKGAPVFDIQNYWSFVAAIIVFQIIPGPGTIAILNATARNGIGAGFGAVFGTLLGDFLFMTAAVAGLAALLQANPVLFKLLQLFGAAYLCWLGLQLLRAKIRDAENEIEPEKSVRVYFRQAFAVSLTNPKVVLFFVAFFPLFLRPDSSLTTLGVMMAHVTVISLLYQAALVLIGNLIARRLKALPSARRIATRLAGVALIGFGIKLASSR
jgi:threonine/homoserine/homoserine lactone efflux protein